MNTQTRLKGLLDEASRIVESPRTQNRGGLPFLKSLN
jgi:hypothetical protein